MEATMSHNMHEEAAIQSGFTSNYVSPYAASPTLPLETLLLPDRPQVRVSLHGRNGMKVCWIAADPNATSIVCYGTSRTKMDQHAAGSSASYTYKHYTSGKIHTVIINSLLDNTTYFYRVGGVHIPTFSFKTPPPLGPNTPIKFAVVGDLGQTQNTKSTLEHIGKSSYDVLILPGDLSYADKRQLRWDSFGQHITPHASSRPWMVTEGNHEIESSKHIEDFRAYNARWEMPYALSGSKSNLYYSFEVASVHWLMLGSYADYKPGSDQYKWLENNLKTVDRSKTPWLIAVVHAPWYSSNRAHHGDGDGMLNAMEDLLFEAQVDIVFAGHVHSYERSFRTYEEKRNDRGIIYITIGDGGNREGLARHFRCQPEWSAFREASYGHGELSIKQDGTAEWTWHRNQDGEEVVADRVSIKSLSTY